MLGNEINIIESKIDFWNICCLPFLCWIVSDNTKLCLLKLNCIIKAPDFYIPVQGLEWNFPPTMYLQNSPYLKHSVVSFKIQIQIILLEILVHVANDMHDPSTYEILHIIDTEAKIYDI